MWSTNGPSHEADGLGSVAPRESAGHPHADHLGKPCRPWLDQGYLRRWDHDDGINYLTSNAFRILVLPVHDAISSCAFAILDAPQDRGHIASPALSLHPPRAPPLD